MDHGIVRNSAVSETLIRICVLYYIPTITSIYFIVKLSQLKKNVNKIECCIMCKGK